MFKIYIEYKFRGGRDEYYSQPSRLKTQKAEQSEALEAWKPKAGRTIAGKARFCAVCEVKTVGTYWLQDQN